MGKGDKSDNFNLFVEVYRLDQIRQAIGDSDPKDVEKKLFAKFNCFTEKEKIEFESRYIMSKLTDKEHSKIDGVDDDLRLVNLILKNVDEFRLKDISKVKRYFVLIGLKYGLNIGFVSEVESVYNAKVAQMKTKKDYKKYYQTDYILPFDNDKPSDEDDSNTKKKEL